MGCTMTAARVIDDTNAEVSDDEFPFINGELSFRSLPAREYGQYTSQPTQCKRRRLPFTEDNTYGLRFDNYYADENQFPAIETNNVYEECETLGEEYNSAAEEASEGFSELSEEKYNGEADGEEGEDEVRSDVEENENENYCETVTLTPTLHEYEPDQGDTEYANSANVSGGNKDASEKPEDPKCVVELLSSYADATPTLRTAPIRVMVARSAVTRESSIPHQIIRYNKTKYVHYGNLGQQFESFPIFNCVRPQLEDDAEVAERVKSGEIGPNEVVEKLLIVLDLDETLVHMHDQPSDYFDYLVNIVEMEDPAPLSGDEGEAKPDIVSFVLHPNMQVSFRPGVLAFLKYLRENSEHYQVALFTAGTKSYANAILHALDPNCDLILPNVRHYRDSCEAAPTPNFLRLVTPTRLGLANQTREENVPTFYFKKNLEVFGWPMERVVFFDNSLLSFMSNPENGVWIKPWRGVEPYLHEGMASIRFYNFIRRCSDFQIPGQDRLYQFSQIVELLEVLRKQKDVREYLRNKFTLFELVEDADNLIEHPIQID